MHGNAREPGTKQLVAAAERLGAAVVRNEPLSGHCTWRIGGPAALLIRPRELHQVRAILHAAREADLPLVVIGKGSNLLFADEGVAGAVVKLAGGLGGLAIDGRDVVAGAGVAVCRLARSTALAALSGLEHAVGIPGTLGGLIAMNGGSCGQCVGDRVAWVEAIDPAGEIHRLSRADCGFAYRRSRFQQPGWTVLRAALMLKRSSSRAVLSDMRQLLRQRRSKFPLTQPNCGSVFRSSPEEYSRVGPPGWLIEQCGLKGLRIGGAEISSRHANFIVNRGQARAAEVMSLICAVREAVQERFAHRLRCEVLYVGPDGRVMPADEACDVRQAQAGPAGPSGKASRSPK